MTFNTCIDSQCYLLPPSYPGLNAEGWVNGNPEEPVGCVLGFAPKVNTPGVLPVKLKLVVLLPNWNAEPRRDTPRFSVSNEKHFLSQVLLACWDNYSQFFFQCWYSQANRACPAPCSREAVTAMTRPPPQKGTFVPFA